MKQETIDRINAAVGAGEATRTEALAIINNPARGPNDPEVASLLNTADEHFAEAETWRNVGNQEDRSEEFSAWRGELEPILNVERNVAVASPLAAPEYRAALDTYLRRGHRDLPMDEIERRALNTGSDTAGGYLVSPDLEAGIAQRLAAASPLFALVSTPPTSKDRVRKRRVRRHTTYGSIYTSAFVGAWTKEIPGATDGAAEPVFGESWINIDKYRALCRLSNDEVDDADFDVLAFLEEDGSRNSALAREYAILVGSGVGEEPLGVMNLPSVTSSPEEDEILAVDIEGSTSNTISNTTAALGTATKILDLFYSLPAQYRNLPSARFVMNSQTEKKVRKLVDANGNFIWAPGFGGTPNTLEGKGIVVSEWMPDDGSDTNKPILWGALEFIKCPVRRGVSVVIANERYVETDEVGFFLSHRMGVGIENYDAFRFGQV